MLFLDVLTNNRYKCNIMFVKIKEKVGCKMGNQIKTFFLLSFMTLIFVFIGSAFGKEGMIIAFIIAVGINFVSYYFSDRLILAIYRAKEISYNDNPLVYNIVAELTQKANMPMPKVYLIPSANPNAFATGRNPNHSAVAVTSGILHLLSDNELKGVLAHELGHIKNRDILVATIAATIAGAIAMMARMLQWTALLGGMGGNRRQGGMLGLLSILLVAVVGSIAALILQMAISRSREYLADTAGARLAGNPAYLSNALRKLSQGARMSPMESANPATAHLFIVSPFRSRPSVLALFSTHPPIEERIARLDGMVV